MPSRWAIASGNWSNSAIWSGSLIPTADDDVWANGRNVFIDQDITVRTLRNHPVTTPAIAAGGSFINTGSRTITCTLPLAGGSGSLGIYTTVYGGFINYQSTASVLLVTGSDTVNIVSDIMGGLVSPPYGYSVTISNTGIVNITGSIAGFTEPGVRTLTVNGGTVNISGSVRGNYLRFGGGANSVGLFISTNKTVNIVGTVSSEAGTSGAGVNFTSNAVLTIIGDVFARNTANIPVSIGNVGGAILIITGSVYPIGTANPPALITTGNTCNMFISGARIVASPGGPAIVHAFTGTSRLQGTISASRGFPGVSYTNAGHQVTATGPFYNVGGRNAVFSTTLMMVSESTPTWTFDTETVNEQRSLYTQNFPGNFPATIDVRSGVSYGDTNQFTGTLIIPSALNVIQGVAVDTSTGSATFTKNNAWSALTSSLIVTGSIGERLTSLATVTNSAVLLTTGSI
jgi:hypothetical protein